MNYELKEKIQLIYELCDMFDKMENLKQNSKFSAKELLRFEILQYIVYLTGADGIVSEEELKIIDDYFDWSLTESLANSLIENLYDRNFKNTIPAILKYFIKMDNICYKKNTNNGNFASEILLEIYEYIGMLTITADSNIEKEEMFTYKSYQSMLENCVKTNLLKNKITQPQV